MELIGGPKDGASGDLSKYFDVPPKWIYFVSGEYKLEPKEGAATYCLVDERYVFIGYLYFASENEVRIGSYNEILDPDADLVDFDEKYFREGFDEDDEGFLF